MLTDINREYPLGYFHMQENRGNACCENVYAFKWRFKYRRF